MSEERFKAPSPEEMTEAQRALVKSVTSGPRGSLRGPFPVFLHSPQLGEYAQRLGAYVRFESILPGKLRELAILVMARHWSAEYEWYAHRELALKEKLDPAIIDAIAAGKTPSGLDADERAVYNFASELATRKQVSDEHFAALRDRLGTQAVVDVIGTLGYYSLVAMILNVNRTALPPGVKPLPPLTGQ
jgi:4-carboxymuconolactone decarboxylase